MSLLKNVETSGTVENNNDLKKAFNIISNSLFLFVLLLAALTLFIPMYSMTLLGTLETEVSGSFSIYNYMFSAQENLTRGALYLIVVAIVVYNVIRGVIYGVMSFKDGNEKIVKYVASAVCFLIIPFLFTRTHNAYLTTEFTGKMNWLDEGIFLPIVLVIGLLSVIIKTALNLILNYQSLTKKQVTSIILNNVAILLLVTGVIIFFSSSALDFTMNELTERHGVWSINAKFVSIGEIYDATDDLIRPLFDDLHMKIVMLLMIYIPVTFALAGIGSHILRNSISITTKKIKLTSMFIIISFVLILLLMIVTSNQVGSVVNPLTETPIFTVSTTNTLVIGVVFTALAAALAIASIVISFKENTVITE